VKSLLPSNLSCEGDTCPSATTQFQGRKFISQNLFAQPARAKCRFEFLPRGTPKSERCQVLHFRNHFAGSRASSTLLRLAMVCNRSTLIPTHNQYPRPEQEERIAPREMRLVCSQMPNCCNAMKTPIKQLSCPNRHRVYYKSPYPHCSAPTTLPPANFYPRGTVDTALPISHQHRELSLVVVADDLPCGATSI
jgi:hypothetical protein